MKRVWKRWGALLLAVAMTLSLLPMAAFAAEGDTPENLARGKTVYVSGLEVEGTDTNAGKAVDGDSGTRWSSNKMHKTTGATNGSNPAWIVVDLTGADACVASITSISTEYYNLVWSTDYVVQVAGNDYTPADFSSNIGVVAASDAAFQGQHAKDAACWTTIKTYSNHTNESNPTDTFTAEDFEKSIPAGTRYLRIYFTKINDGAGGASIGLEEITVMGTTQPTATQYVRHTGPIEEGTYIIYSNSFNLHNSDPTTGHCDDPDPTGDTISDSHGNGTHLWRIAGNETDGYTIQGVQTDHQKYLTATPSGTQLALSTNGSDAVKLTFTPSGNGYTVSYVDGTTTKYLRWTDTNASAGTSRGWNFSTTENVVQIFKQTVIPVTIAAADDGSRDVGAESGVYSNENNAVIDVKAPSQEGVLVAGTNKNKDGPVTYAVDGDEDTRWHTRYSGASTTEEIATKEDTNSGVKGWGESKLQESLENRWIELDLVGGAQWLSGLRYLGRNSGGDVLACEIRVWDETAGAWAKVTSNTVWTIGNGRGWSYKEFDCPVQTSKVRLYGVDTHAGAQADHNKWMIAREIRLVKALTETAPATQTVTVTVKNAEGNPIDGATVNSATTDTNGQVTLTLKGGMTYIFTVAKEGYKTKTVKVQTDGENTAVEVTLRAPLNLDATVATYDYPLTQTMVSAVSEKDPPGYVNDGYVYWAIDYNTSHWWHQDYDVDEDLWFAFSLPAEVAIAGIRYQKRTDGTNAFFGGYEIQTSTDGTTWTTLEDETGTWGNDNDVHVHTLEEPQTAQYFRVHGTGGARRNRTAKLFQLVLAPEARTTVTGTVTKDSQPMSGVTVQVYQGDTATYKTATTGSDGSYSIVLPKDGTTDSWKLVVDASGCKRAEYTVTTNAATDTHDFALENRELHLTGTAPEGVTVQLMQGAGRIPVAGIAAQTGTSFDFNVSTLAAGTYYLRAWKDGYTPAWKEVTWTAATESPVTVTVADSDLVAVAAGNAGSFTFDDGITGFQVLNGGNSTVSNESGALKIVFNGTRNTMWNNAVGHIDSRINNGTIEFDITPTTGNNNAYGRLGLALRQDNSNFLYVGHGDGAGKYFAQNSMRSNSNDVSGQYHEGSETVQLVKDLKRHVKVTLNNGTVTVWVDDIQVLNWTNAYNQGVGSVAFTSEKGCTVLIDNLNITREDTASAVTWTTGDGETLNAVITTPYDQAGVALSNGGNAFAGDTIKITGTKTDAILNAVTVNGGAVTVTKTAVEGGGYAYTFTMPAAAATVAGTFVDLIPDFTVSGADANGNISAGTVGESGFTGNTLAITGELASDNDAEIQWYKKTGDGEWTEISGATSSSYTLKQSDYNSTTTTKLKVKVTGNGTHHAGWKESGEFTVTALVYAVTGVSLERDTLTMWTNYTPTTSGEFPTEVGGTATLTASVAPDNVTGAEITWTSDNTSAVTVVKNTTNPKMATLTAAGKGTANITVSVTAGGVTKTATCAVTVKTKVESITVNGLTDNKVIVYTNDGEDSIDVTATVLPATANDKTLVWTRPASGSSLIKIDRKSGTAPEGEGDDKAESSGAGVTITAIGSETNVGQVTVTVKAKSDETVTQTFTVEVRHKLAEDHNITIANDAKVGTTLTVNTGALIMTTAGKNALTYKWYRLDSADAEITEGMTAISTEKEYTLVSADKDKYIAVVVTAAESTYYEGTKKAVTAKVELADGPAAPTLSATDVDGATKGTITITDPVDGESYEYRKKTDDGWGAWTTDNLENGVISELEAGDYQVRIQENTTHQAGTAEAISVGDVTKQYFNVTVTMDPTTGAGTAVRSATTVEEGKSVTLTVTPAAAYNIKSVKNGEETLTGTAGENGAMEYTVSNVQAAVVFAVTFEKKQVTITLALTNLTATCNEEVEHTGETTHTVDYGAVTKITLDPDTGYELPSSITVTYTDGTEVPTTRCEYDNETGEISFPQGVQRNITITAEATQKKYSVQLADDDGVLSLTGAAEVNHDATFSGTLNVSNTTQYALPETLTSVTMGGTALTAGTGYTYNNSTGAISIPNVTGNVVITATAVEKKTQLTGVTIAILHNDDTGMGSSNQNVPHVGDTLTATAAPTGATVTYQWFVGDSTTAAGTSQTYVVKDGDTGTIKVVVTGTGAFEGTKEAITAAVGEKTWRVTGVSLNKTTTSLVFGGEETLTATVEPSTATNKKVTWSSNNTSVATVDANGKVTATGKGTAIITVTTEDGEQTATCAVTVTATALPALQINKPQVDKTASVSFAGGVSTSVATYEWYTGDSNDAENGTWIRVSGASGSSWLVTGVPSGKYIKVVAYAKDDGNYTGSSTVVSEAILSNDTEVEKYGITVNTTGDGTVTVKVNDTEATEAAEGDGVTVEVTGVVTGATVEVASTTDGVALEKGTGNTWTFTMPAEAVEITVTITEPVVEKYAITVSGAENGTVTANKTEAAEGQTVTLTVTPADGYKLDTLTVSGDSGAVTVTDNTFVMPAEAVTVTATFVEDTTPVDTSALEAAITAAQKLHDSVEVAESAEEVPNNKQFVTDEAEKTALANAIATAQEALEAENKTAESIADAVEALNAAVAEFEEACQWGTKATSNPPVIVLPSKDPEVTENDDGSKTTTETKPDGTVIETTEKPDGTVEVVETKKDGTVTETTTQPDGTKEVVETKPDGTVTETTEKPDGSSVAVETKPDGTVTEIKTDADGAKVEKVTDPEEGVTITATDADGETVAEMKIPTVMPELETRFEDVPVGHWADKAIHQLAAVEVVEGVGDNKYDMASPMNRGALATVLHRLANKPAGSEVSFEDVLDGKYYTEGVAWAAKVGVVKGFSAEEFKPEETITREQLALMLMRYAKLLGMDTSADATEVAKFADGKNTHAWALDGIAWCVKAEIIRGRTDGTLAPTDNVTRAEVAVMIDRFIALMK